MQLSIPALPKHLCQWRSIRIWRGGFLLVWLCFIKSASAAYPLPDVVEQDSLKPSSPPAFESLEPKPKPWGRLLIRPIQLKPPEESLKHLNFTETRYWSFGSLEWSEIYHFLREAGLTTGELSELTHVDRRVKSTDGKINLLRTSNALLLGLAAESRRIIYDRLAQFPGNGDHALPFVLRDLKYDAQQDFNPKLLNALERLSFYRHGIRCLTDAIILPRFVEDQAELIRLKRYLVTNSALHVEVSRESGTEAQDFIDYWSARGTKPAKHLLRILEESPELTGLDIAHFLPPIPQSILNRFPDDDLPPSINCFWTSLNFFSRNPDHRFLPVARENGEATSVAMAALEKDYELVSGDFAFGDVIALIGNKLTDDAQPELLHVVSYIADDIVMTKNGANDFTPINLMTLGQVVSLYAWPAGVELKGFRLKSLPAVESS
ncbi:MAG: hypothetical protein SynsKO_11690 [Synoicihabitans sp.]